MTREFQTQSLHYWSMSDTKGNHHQSKLGRKGTSRATVLKKLFFGKTTNMIIFEGTAAETLTELKEEVQGGRGGKSCCCGKILFQHHQCDCFFKIRMQYN